MKKALVILTVLPILAMLISVPAAAAVITVTGTVAIAFAEGGSHDLAFSDIEPFKAHAEFKEDAILLDGLRHYSEGAATADIFTGHLAGFASSNQGAGATAHSHYAFNVNVDEPIVM